MNRRALAIGALTVLALAAPFAVGHQTYVLFIVAEFFVYAIVALSLDLLMGRSGQISLGQSGFLAIGAYTAALLSVHLKWEIALTMLAGGLVAAASSVLLGIPATRMSGHYLGIVTLGFGVAVSQIALKWSDLTGGDEGLHLSSARLLSWSVASPTAMYYVCFAALVLTVIGLYRLLPSRIGRSFAAVRDSQVAATAMGVPVARTKVLAFACSAFLAGAAGALFAWLNGFISPEDFGLAQTLLFFAMVVLGGMASIPGVIAGALVVETVEQSAATIGGLSLTLLGAAIVAVVLFFPGGIASVGARFRWRGGGDGRAC